MSVSNQHVNSTLTAKEIPSSKSKQAQQSLNANGSNGPKLIGWRSSVCGIFKRNSSLKNNNNDILSGEGYDMKMKGNLLPINEDLKIVTNDPKNKQKPLALFDIKFILLLLAFVSSLCGTVVMWFTDIYSSQIFSKLTLANNTALHVSWRKPPLEPLLCIYIFNYTNTNSYLSREDPELIAKEAGPFCYREMIERLNLTFYSNHTLAYNEQRLHTYDEGASGLPDDVLVTVPNIPLLTGYSTLAEMDIWKQILARPFLGVGKYSPFITLPVKEFLFGYEDEMVDNLKSAAKFAGKPVPYDNFGILIKRAGLSKDRLTIYTGEHDLNQMGQVTNINNITQYSIWNSEKCNNVSGSDGLFFNRVHVKNFNDVYLFHKDSCRSLPLQYHSKVNVGSDIAAHRYILKPKIFNNEVESNACYCASDICKIADGVLDIRKCANGVPMIVSRPHFLEANISDGLTIKGMKPNANNHSFHLDLFPALGLTVRMLMRMQMNVQVRNPKGESNLGPLPDKFILPVTWVEMNSGEVPRKMFSLLYHLTYTMRWCELALMWGFIILTIIFAILVMRYSISKTSANKEILIISKNRKSNSITSNTYIPA